MYYNLGQCVAIIVMQGQSYVEFYIRMVFVWVDERPWTSDKKYVKMDINCRLRLGCSGLATVTRQHVSNCLLARKKALQVSLFGPFRTWIIEESTNDRTGWVKSRPESAEAFPGF